MAKFELIYDRPGETPMYLGTDDDVGGTDAAINAALPEVPVGTVITTAGFGTMKQLGSGGHWATLETGGDSGGSGYTVEETKQTVIAEQTVTTTQTQGAYTGQVTADFTELTVGTTCVVTFNGEDYTIVAEESQLAPGAILLGEFEGGAPSFANYPFVLFGVGETVYLYSSTASPTIKAEAVTKTVTPSDDFKAAVKASGSGGAIVLKINQNLEVSETWQTIYNAIVSGTRVVFNSQTVEEGYTEIQVIDITYVYGGNGSYGIEGGENFQAVCTSADDFPVLQA